MNKIKAILHNRVLYQLINEVRPKYDYIIVDEFARENRYYEYLNGQVNVQRGITFLTKAEDISPAVGCASIISRYIFLKEFDKLSKELGIPLLKGANDKQRCLFDTYGLKRSAYFQQRREPSCCAPAFVRVPPAPDFPQCR